jgi:hypothetical protein
MWIFPHCRPCNRGLSRDFGKMRREEGALQYGDCQIACKIKAETRSGCMGANQRRNLYRGRPVMRRKFGSECIRKDKRKDTRTS